MSNHKFEIEGLGRAPFQCVGNWIMPSRSLMEHNPTAWNRAIAEAPCRIGSCAYCWTPLSIHYIIKDADGKLFAVGSECVEKTGDAGLIDKARALKNKRAREIRARKTEIARNLRMMAQREKWAGLNKYQRYEFNRKVWDARVLLEKKPVIDTLAPFVDTLRSIGGNFVTDIANTMEKGNLPFGRGLAITCEILAKQCGRRNSKAYKAEYSRVKEIFDSISS